MTHNITAANSRRNFSGVPVRIVLYLYALIVLLPIFWVIYTSFKTNAEFVANPWAFGKNLRLENYINAWGKVKFNVYIFNSIVITIASVALVTFLASAVSYILARVKMKINTLLLFIFLSGLYVPTALILPSEFLLLNGMGIINSRFSLVLLFTVFSLPYTILILSGFFRSMPAEIEEAARIDGCGYNRLFWMIVFPLARSGVVAALIFNAIWIWNDYIFALTFISSPEKRTLPVGLIGLMATFRLRADWVTLFAGLNMVMIPSIILYILFQKKLTGGLTAGAVKG
jgi:ABC-type glycerol-3-phosphate transport system permease component